jgi:hypothetical protein
MIPAAKTDCKQKLITDDESIRMPAPCHLSCVSPSADKQL